MFNQGGGELVEIIQISDTEMAPGAAVELEDQWSLLQSLGDIDGLAQDGLKFGDGNLILIRYQEESCEKGHQK